MSEGAMPDAGEVVAQIEALHDADLRPGRRPLHIESGWTSLCVKQRGARLMYVLQLPARVNVRAEQEEISFELTNADDAITLFVAHSICRDADHWLSVRLKHDNGECLSQLRHKVEPFVMFDVAQTEFGRSMHRMLSIIQNAIA